METEAEDVVATGIVHEHGPSSEICSVWPVTAANQRTTAYLQHIPIWAAGRTGT